MFIVEQLLAGLSQAFGNFWFIASHGGWLVFILLVTYILYILYRMEITTQFLKSQEWTFLNIRIPPENLVSTLAVEQIFYQLHALQRGFTFAHVYIEGRVQLWYSLELVSLGGKISFIIRCPKPVRDLVESAIYSQYPQAEITEVSDYLENLVYDPAVSEFDLWGTDLKLTDPQVLPLKTYKDFEHPTAEEKIIDPLAPVFEGLTKIEPHEFYGIQMLLQPLGDDDWKPEGEAKVKELLGEKPVTTIKFWDIILTPFTAFANFSYTSLFTTAAKPEEKKEGKTFQSLTDTEKERINGIQRKISKPGYRTKIRHLYIAPKDRFNPGKVAIILGAFRSIGSANTNRLKPDAFTKTGIDYTVSPTLEAPFIAKKIKKRKVFFFNGFKNRTLVIGSKPFILNTEELVTLYHLPISLTTTAQPPMDKVEAKKAQPPANLPVGEY